MSDPFPFRPTRSKPQNGALTAGDDNEAVDIELKRRQAVKCQRKAGRKFFPLLGNLLEKRERKGINLRVRPGAGQSVKRKNVAKIKTSKNES